MELKVYKDITAFYSDTKEFYLKEEVENNLPYGLLKRLMAERGSEIPFMAAAIAAGGIRIAYLMTPPHNLIITAAKGVRDEEILRSADLLLAENIELPGVIGEKEAARRFGEHWSKRTGRPLSLIMDQRIYVLEKLNSIKLPEGRLIEAGPAQRDLLYQWVKEFCSETGVLFEEERIREMISRTVTFLWEDENGNPVSMAREGRRTESGAVVTLVYTPKELRSRGFAGAVVSGISGKILEDRKYCCLYTDLSNPVSNGLYIKIGYRPVCDSVSLKFS
ncbi:GNAT family N-acetyltransferase [Peribacillus sp. SCS-37]|uniref:GNAT family N-acetyltransferase n=1 Tax=Paraperibacillus esterisolvens TaxID=3115296 RepID=UPI0039066903